MVASTRTFLQHLRDSVTKSSMYIVVICLSIPAIFGMPYLDAPNNLEKLYQDSYLDEPATSNEIEELIAAYQRPTHPFQELGNLLDERYGGSDNDEGYDMSSYDLFGNRDDKLVSARAKRFGYPSFPFRFTRQYILKNQNRPLPELIKAANDFQSDEFPPVKRRLAFTALRGR